METIYIELEAACAALRAQEKVDEDCWIPAGRRFDARRACAAISSVPYADVAPVVRCRDCIYYKDYRCNRWDDGTMMFPHDYCSRGAKMEEK